jgi:hypothetical protein
VQPLQLHGDVGAFIAEVHVHSVQPDRYLSPEAIAGLLPVDVELERVNEESRRKCPEPLPLSAAQPTQPDGDATWMPI